MPRPPRATVNYRTALDNWNAANESDKKVAKAFWKTMMKANNSTLFADQSSLYGVAEKHMGFALGAVTGLRKSFLQALVGHIVRTDEFDIPHALETLTKEYPPYR